MGTAEAGIGDRTTRQNITLVDSGAAGLWVGLTFSLLELGFGLGIGAVSTWGTQRAPGIGLLGLVLGFWVSVGLVLGIAAAVAARRSTWPGAVTLSAIVGGVLAIDLIALVSARGLLEGSIWWQHRAALQTASCVAAVLCAALVYLWARRLQSPIAPAHAILASLCASTPIWCALTVLDPAAGLLPIRLASGIMASAALTLAVLVWF